MSHFEPKSKFFFDRIAGLSGNKYSNEKGTNHLSIICPFFLRPQVS
jgi:hypothetical protein